MKPLIEIINQLAVLEDKTINSEELTRPFNRIKLALEEMGYTYSSPVNEPYKETRTDLEATITGDSTVNLTITKVIKPIIIKDGQMIQRAVVIVESK